ncbi:hypothetical protein Pint_15309 [Pistacia integerrima]|uniref:Uncharacterized protein n=1 Tax=Pistacia integerrima TaxID=434235 RepID=A0ACC0ZDG5_9ROSI|nr:hypothetical protein Pint_15309 [Pistacia integerrima]
MIYFKLILCLFFHQLDASTEGEDLISKLPDDTLVDIICRLNLEEAARTSSLSSRWKHLWNFSTVLNFAAPRKLWKFPVITLLLTRAYLYTSSIEKHKTEIDERKNRYISWVNKVLELHRGSSINESRICFELGGSHETVITDWINTVIAKRVQKLELNLERCLGGDGKKYTFPQEWNNILETPHGLSGLKSLKSLSLVDVCVTRQALEIFIYNCPLLEQQIKLHVGNVPLLRDVSIGGEYGVRLKNLIGPVRTEKLSHSARHSSCIWTRIRILCDSQYAY